MKQPRLLGAAAILGGVAWFVVEFLRRQEWGVPGMAGYEAYEYANRLLPLPLLLLMAGLLLGTCALIAGGDWVEAIAATATTVAGSVAVLGAALIAGTKVSEFLQARASQSDGIGRWLQHGRGPWFGLATGAASLGFYAWARVLDSPFGPWAAGALLTFLSIVFFWALRPVLGVVTAASWGFLVACLMRVAPAGN